MKNHLKIATICVIGAGIYFLVSCASLQRLPSSSSSKRNPASSEPLVTFCAKETAPASTPQEKKWRDAFSIEVMERICNKEPEIAKNRINFQNWLESKYLETSWDYGIDLTGVQHGWPRGTLITSRHMISTKHFSHHPQVGETMWFLSLDNRMISRKVIQIKYLDSADLAVIRLDSDVPGSIHPLRVLAPEAFQYVPDKIPVWRIEQQFKALIVEKQGWGFKVPGSSYGDSFTNPTGRAFAQYYQNMVRFDSSSPSVLILRNEYGVMPILYSLVTFGGVGNGPLLHQHLTDIQNTIASFGDPHLLQKAMPPISPPEAPSCSIRVARTSDGQSCNISVKASADPVKGNPIVSPVSPQSWAISGNQWTGSVDCPSDPATVFEATLSGPGGTGRSCESAALGPILPQCTLTVSRQGNSEVCDVSVTRTFGNPSHNPVLSPGNPTDWVRDEDVWTGTTTCPLNRETVFRAALSDKNGEGPECSSSVKVFSEVPRCELTSSRVGYSDTCELTVTRISGITSGNPTVSPINPTGWTRNGDTYKGIVFCNTEDYSSFSAYFSGPLGAGEVCRSPSVLSVAPEIVFCELTAVREGLTNICKLKTTYVRGWMRTKPIATPRNPSNWSSNPETPNNFEGTTNCAYNSSTQFSAHYPSYGDLPGRVCFANPVDKILAPACNLEVAREGISNQCNYTLSAVSTLGTITTYNFDGGANRTVWNGSSPVKGKLTCSQTTRSTFDAHVWGPGAAPQSNSCRASVSRLPLPSCQLSAQRRRRTSVCDLTLSGSGVIDTSKAPKITPSGTGRWLGTVWKGSASCPTNRATTFSAGIWGPGGSQGTCTSNLVPKL